MNGDEMTPGEIGRSLKRLEDSQALQTRTLGEIKEQTTKTNGRVTALERDVRDLKRDHRVEHHDGKRVTDRPDIITVSIPAGTVSAKTVTTVVASVLAGLIAAWKAGLFS
jgi:hypothetical protein